MPLYAVLQRLILKFFKKVIDKFRHLCYYTGALRETPSESEYGRVVELVDSLDSGSSVHCGRAGSSPASPTIKIPQIERFGVFFCTFQAESFLELAAELPVLTGVLTRKKLRQESVLRKKTIQRVSSDMSTTDNTV